MDNRATIGFALMLSFLVLGSGRRIAYGLTVSPGRTEIQAVPGQVVRSTLSISNEANATVHIAISEKDWFILPQNSTWTVESWLYVLGSTQFDLKSGEHRNIPIAIKCPRGAEGDLVGMVSFRYPGDGPSTVTPMISVSVYLTVAGTQRFSGEISEVLIRRYPTGVMLGADIKATGNVHLRPSGTAILEAPLGREIARYNIPGGDPVYPGHDRPYTLQDGSIKLNPGRYQLRIDFRDRELQMNAKRGFTVLADGKIEADSLPGVTHP